MADPYYRYAPPERDITDTRAAFPGYLPSEASTLASRPSWDGGSLRTSVEFGKNDVLPLSRDYGLGDFQRIDTQVTPGLGGLTAGASVRAFTPLEDPALLRRDVPLNVKPSIVDYEPPDPLRKPEGLAADESNILFVDGLPNDCTRREVAHLFRPFIGFKEIRVVHKEARRSGDKAYVLCFVEFNDSKCALTAMDALQGYKFDDKKPNAPVLRIQFAKFPFQLTSRDERRHGSAH
ncbi:uncharacterized protein A4U43_C08F5320 [Asparagus officinalis]|uniref:nuclear speckle RNA-binding protein A-like n=1 Tax=Asparagus officinalis TaxID=4686 RepID=UPI00098DF4B7|nr:nuclear speckle RNA-binding protein A-like [Asparagus officinalis]ONK59329.1 uncharacterized protein A4U43_C08F5320 [Asparagus officinalis]